MVQFLEGVELQVDVDLQEELYTNPEQLYQQGVGESNDKIFKKIVVCSY